jgi:hypothetical protein
MRLLHTRPGRSFAIVVGVVALAGVAVAAGDDKSSKPSVSLKASPQVGFSPLRVVLTAELKGGANDFEDFYCPTIEWYWDDDTKSESRGDCDPYEAGKSEIKRRYTIDRIFNTSGEFRVEFRLKQRGKTVGLGKTSVRVRPGIRDGGGLPY